VDRNDFRRPRRQSGVPQFGVGRVGQPDALHLEQQLAAEGDMREGKHPSVREVTDVPGGTIEIDGEFKLPIVAEACLQAIERAGYKLTPR
jgi:hypothetical protein